jgi:hypothetical protein
MQKKYISLDFDDIGSSEPVVVFHRAYNNGGKDNYNPSSVYPFEDKKEAIAHGIEGGYLIFEVTEKELAQLNFAYSLGKEYKRDESYKLTKSLFLFIVGVYSEVKIPKPLADEIESEKTELEQRTKYMLRNNDGYLVSTNPELWQGYCNNAILFDSEKEVHQQAKLLSGGYVMRIVYILDKVLPPKGTRPAYALTRDNEAIICLRDYDDAGFYDFE